MLKISLSCFMTEFCVGGVETLGSFIRQTASNFNDMTFRFSSAAIMMCPIEEGRVFLWNFKKILPDRMVLHSRMQ
jgi:hypothetical protein